MSIILYLPRIIRAFLHRNDILKPIRTKDFIMYFGYFKRKVATPIIIHLPTLLLMHVDDNALKYSPKTLTRKAEQLCNAIPRSSNIMTIQPGEYASNKLRQALEKKVVKNNPVANIVFGQRVFGTSLIEITGKYEQLLYAFRCIS